jgi:heme-degrading monooxygenase HmoA
MILTVLDARVALERAHDLQAAYNSAGDALPPGFIRSNLLQDSADPEQWRIQTMWESREALEAMRSKGTPGGVLIFRSAGAEPTLTVFSVMASLDRP